MLRLATLTIVALLGILLPAGPAQAQVYVRVPFVRVQVDGGGTYVRAPFVNLWFPSGQPYQYYPGPSTGPAPTAPGVFPSQGYGPAEAPNAPPRLTPLLPSQTNPPTPSSSEPKPSTDPLPVLPPPRVLPEGNDAAPPPPQPLQTRHPSLQEFAKTFQARAGSFDVTIINPVTNQPTQVKFTLPEGSPRRVIVNRDEIEFRYAPLQFVRIEFDRDGATVTSRMR